MYNMTTYSRKPKSRMQILSIFHVFLVWMGKSIPRA